MGNCQGDNIKGRDLSCFQIVLCSPEEEKEGEGQIGIPMYVFTRLVCFHETSNVLFYCSRMLELKVSQFLAKCVSCLLIIKSTPGVFFRNLSQIYLKGSWIESEVLGRCLCTVQLQFTAIRCTNHQLPWVDYDSVHGVNSQTK